MPPRAKRSRGRPGTSVTRVAWDGESPWIAAELLQVQGRVADGGEVRRSVIDDDPGKRSCSPRDLDRRWNFATKPRHMGSAKRGLYVARKTAGIATEKERIPNGCWLSSLTPNSGAEVKMALYPAPEMFAIFAIFAKFAVFPFPGPL